MSRPDQLPATGMVVAAVDIGTNTIKLTVARCFADGRIDTLAEENDTVRIGVGIERTGQIDPNRLDRAVTTLATFEQVGRSLGAETFIGVATEALRIAANGRDLLDRIARETAWQIRIISGDEEARLTFLGLRAWLPAFGNATIVDIGGGSTEIIAAADRVRESGVSLPIGSGRLADRWLRSDPPGDVAIRSLVTDAETFLGEHAAVLDGRGGALLLSGGNGQFIEALRRHLEFPDALGIGTIESILTWLASEPVSSVAEILSIQPERAAVLPAGVAIALAVARLITPAAVEAVPSGIRLGLLQEHIERAG